MSFADVNLLDPHNALEAFNRSTLTSRGVSNVSPTWGITDGSYSVTDRLEKRYTPEFFSLAVTPNSTSPVSLYLDSLPLPDPIPPVFAPQFLITTRSESGVTVNIRIAPAGETLPQGTSVYCPANEWTTERSDILSVPVDAGYSTIRLWVTFSGHSGVPFVTTMPVLLDSNGFKASNIVANARHYMPTYYWDVDAQQPGLTYPMFRLFDVLTYAANNAMTKYIEYFPMEVGERSPVDPNDTLSRSTLVDPDFVAPENFDWLAQFAGASLVRQVLSENYTYNVEEKTTNSYGTAGTAGELWNIRDNFAGYEPLSELDDPGWATLRSCLEQLFTQSTISTNKALEKDSYTSYSYQDGVIIPTGGRPRHFALWEYGPNITGLGALTANFGIHIPVTDPVTKKKSYIYGNHCLIDTTDGEQRYLRFPFLQFTDPVLARKLCGQNALIRGSTTFTGTGGIAAVTWINENNLPPSSLDIQYVSSGGVTSGTGANTSVCVDVDASGMRFVMSWPIANDTGSGYRGLMRIRTYAQVAQTGTSYFDVDLSEPGDAVNGAEGVGYKCRISYDGKAAATMNRSAGFVRVYDDVDDTVTAGVWTARPDVYSPGGSDLDDFAISADGSKVLLLNRLATTKTMWLMEWDGSTWKQNTPTITKQWPVTAGTGDPRCDMSGDGSIIVLTDQDSTVTEVQLDGSPDVEYLNAGLATSFRWDGQSWLEVPIPHVLQAQAFTGSSIKIDHYGRTLALGSRGWLNSTPAVIGRVDVFDLVKTDLLNNNTLWEWVPRCDPILGITTDIEGFEVDISDNGEWLISVTNSNDTHLYGLLRTTSGLSYVKEDTISAYQSNGVASTYKPSRSAIQKWAAYYRYDDPIWSTEIFDGPVYVYTGTEDHYNGSKSLRVVFQDANGVIGNTLAKKTSFETVLDGLTKGQKFFVENGLNNAVFGGTFEGFWKRDDLQQEDWTPAPPYSNDRGYDVFYESTFPIVSGVSAGAYPAEAEFGDPAVAVYDVETDGAIGTKMSFRNLNSTYTLISDVDREDFLRWQTKFGYFGFRAGSRESMTATIKRLLTGTKTVAVSPHYQGILNRVHLRTLASETPAIDATTSESPDVLALAEYTRPTGYFFTHETVDKLYFTLNNIGIGRLDISVLA